MAQPIYRNPFALNTACGAWKNQQHSIPRRVVDTIQGGVKDIFLKNTFDLTVGNIKNISLSSETRLKEIAKISMTVLFGVSYSLILYGGSFYLIGREITSLGNHRNFSYVTPLGKRVATAGEKIFLCGAVPLYGTCYALPKKAIKLLPKIIWTLAPKVYKAAQWTSEHIGPFCERFIQPIGEAICKILKAVARKVDLMRVWIVKKFLSPFWNHVMKPVCIVVGKKIALSARWIFRHVLVPFWRQVLSPILHKVRFRSHKIYAAVMRNVLAPCFYAAEKVAKSLGKTLLDQVILPIGNHLTFTAHKIFEYQQEIFHRSVVLLEQRINRSIALR